MELRTLYYFLTVAKEENITRAAKQLYIGQPTLSRQLIQLEEEIGSPLFIRGKRKMELTEEGLILKRRAEEILNLVDKTEKELMNKDAGMVGEISIGESECLATYTFLPEVIEAFSKKYQQITYDFYTANADIIKEKLDQGIIDIGILSEPVDIEKYEFIRLPQRERWGILVSKQHPLANKDTVTKEDLLTIPLINTKRPIVQKEIANWFKDYYQQLHFIATYNLLSNTISLAAKGIGSVITIEGAFYVHSNENVKFIPFYPELSTGTVLVWKKSTKLPLLLCKFIEQVQISLNEL